MSKEKIEIIKDIYAQNDLVADELKRDFSNRGIFCVNVLGSPGAGKTSCLIQIIKRLSPHKCYVIEGDIESDIDTKTLLALGVETIQINTGGACHLDSIIIQNVIDNSSFSSAGFLFIENIGNLVCPAEFKIGEHIKMLISSVAEGSDKPYKYPVVFENADIILLNKLDLMPYVDFDSKYFVRGVKSQNYKAPIFKVSGKTGDGFDEVATFLKIKKLTILEESEKSDMCIAIPGMIIEKNGTVGKVDFSGNLLSVELELINANVGDYVLVHAGCAISVLSKDEAQEMIQLFKDLEEVLND